MTSTERYIERSGGLSVAFERACTSVSKIEHTRVRHDTFCECCGAEQHNGSHVCIDCCGQIFRAVKRTLLA